MTMLDNAIETELYKNYSQRIKAGHKCTIDAIKIDRNSASGLMCRCSGIWKKKTWLDSQWLKMFRGKMKDIKDESELLEDE